MKYFLITFVTTFLGVIGGFYTYIYEGEIVDSEAIVLCGNYVQLTLTESLTFWTSTGLITGLLISAAAKSLSANNEKHLSLGLPNV